MKHAVHLGALSLAIIIAGSSDVAARKGPGMSDVTFEELDTDGNGELTKAELDARRTERFARMDANGDGAVTRDEIEAHIASHAGANAERMMQRFDKDEDGKLTEAEMQPRKQRGERMFSRLDADGNGSLNKSEFESAKTKMKRWRKRHKDADGE